MANSFSKEEIVLFENMLDGFEDMLVLSRNVNIFRTNQTDMARTGDVISRPMPYIMESYDGQDQSSNFGDKVQLSVPSTIDIFKSANFAMDSLELRDSLQSERLTKAAAQRLASDINVAIMDIAADQSSLVVPVATSATGFDDVALCEEIFNAQGIPGDSRYLALSTKDYNGMAGNLANRQYLGDKKTLTAYEKAYVGEIASFETYKLDYANRISAAAGGAITMDTQDAAVNYYVPTATTTSGGVTGNTDNRYQNITVSATANVAVGDAFTVADLNAVHHITKGDTGELKTFRVVEVVDGTTLKITPPMITNQVSSDAGTQYQNCVINTKSATSAITWLNIAGARINPFWRKDALEIIPGKIAVPENAGLSVLRGTTENGIEMVMSKQTDINTYKTKYRVDVYFGVNNLCPEQTGIIIFDQT